MAESTDDEYAAGGYLGRMLKRSRQLGIIAGLIVGVPVAWSAGSQEDPVVARGQHLAEIICSVCHIVETNQEFAPLLQSPTPRFRDIANRPGTTEKSIIEFLKTTHWDEKTIPMTMPDPTLMTDQRTALARYILSLRTKR